MSEKNQKLKTCWRTITTLLPACFSVLFTVTIANAQSCPTELYIGFYQEDRLTNPEDPLPGSLYLLLPKEDGEFSGDLLFTYVGCQSRNLGRISGTRTGISLNGDWEGIVDDTSQSGSFSGSRINAETFSGDYTVAGGKQNIVVANCADYFIAPYGTWTLFSAAQDSEDDELLSFEGNSAVWTPVSNSSVTQCGLIDLDEENCNESTTAVWQDVALSSARTLTIPESLLTDQSSYTLTCSQFDIQGNRLAFSKVTFEYGTGTTNFPIMPPIYLLLDSEDQ